MVEKIIFDTDPGVDDAMALLFAHLSPSIDLVGITTVMGNVCIESATRNALYLKERFAIPAPVYKGASQPILGKKSTFAHFVHGDDGLGNIGVPTPQISPENEDASEFIVDLITKNPGEITIVAVGPLTNLALALQLKPDIADLVKNVVIMGGALGSNGHTGNMTPVAEANIFSDPHAADIVFQAPWPLTMVGLDVTMETIMSNDYLKSLQHEGGEIGDFIYKISRYYSEFHKDSVALNGIYVHDFSAIAFVVNPGLFKLTKGAVRAVTEGIAVGQTTIALAGKNYPPNPWDNVPQKHACIEVNSKGVLDLYKKVITS